MSEERKSINVTEVGDRPIEASKKTFSIPWFRVQADYNDVTNGDVWRQLKPVARTKAWYAARYGEIEWTIHGEEKTETVRTTGLDFSVPFQQPQSGAVRTAIRNWAITEDGRQKKMRFRNGFLYVFCLDRLPEKSGETVSGMPVCDLIDELEHVVGVIEIERTYVWKSLPRWEIEPLSLDALTRFRKERRNELEYAVEKSNSEFHVYTQSSQHVLTESLADKFLYAIGSSVWTEREARHRFQRKPVVVIRLAFETAEGPVQLLLQYESGAYYVSYADRHYSVVFPHLLDEVSFKMISNGDKRE